MNDNTCSICLEPLLGAADGKRVGTTVPCGHCFHTDCFSQWLGTRGKHCKCPNCNVKSKNFVNLFLSVGEANDALADDDDDLSLSSTEQDDETVDDDNNDDNNDEKNEPTEKENGNEDILQLINAANTYTRQQNERNQSNGTQQSQEETFNDEENDDDSVQVVVDQGAASANNDISDTVSGENDDDDSVQVVDPPVRSRPPEREASAETSASSPVARRQRQPSAAASAVPISQQSNSTQKEEGDETKRFKKIAKKYKRKFLQKQSQCQEQYKQHQELASRMKDVQNSAEENQGELDDLKKQSHYYRLEVSNLQLADVRRSNELLAKNRQVAKLTSDVQRISSEYTKLKVSYERNLSQAHSSSTAEVKELATRTKDLEQENARLKGAMSQQQQQQPSRGGYQRRLDPMDSILQKKKRANKKPSKDVVRALRDMDAVRTIPGTSSKRKSEDDPPPTYDTSRYSAQAARINMAVAHNKKRKNNNPLSLAAAEMLQPRGSTTTKARPTSETTSLNLTKNRNVLQRMNSHDRQQTNNNRNHGGGGGETSLTLTKVSRKPLQRMNSHDRQIMTTTTTQKKKNSPKMASIFQRR